MLAVPAFVLVDRADEPVPDDEGFVLVAKLVVVRLEVEVGLAVVALATVELDEDDAVGAGAEPIASP